MTGFDDDRELDDFLARRSPLHRRLADADDSEPPAEIDRLVLDKARQAIGVSTNSPVYRSPRWALPVALAATVVLALAVVVNFERTQHGTYPVAGSASPAANAAGTESFAADTKAAPIAPVAPPAEAELSKRGAAPPAAVANARPSRPPLLANSAARMTRMQTEEHAASHAKREEPAVAALTQATAPLPAAPPIESKHADRQAWLSEIARLRAAGKTHEADQELAAFRKVFAADTTPADSAQAPASAPLPSP